MSFSFLVACLGWSPGCVESDQLWVAAVAAVVAATLGPDG